MDAHRAFQFFFSPRGTAALVMLVLCAALQTPTVRAQGEIAGTLGWNIHIDQIDPLANTFNVTETYDLTVNGSFHRGTRAIPMTTIESIDEATVSEDGRPLVNECDDVRRAGTYCVFPAEGDTVIAYTYFLHTTPGTTKHLEIRYRVTGALHIYDTGDQLWWVAVSNEHQIPVISSTITLDLPESLRLPNGIAQVTTRGAPASVAIDGTTITVSASEEIPPQQTLEIRVEFPHTPNAHVGVWQPAWDASAAQRAAAEQIEQWSGNINVIVIAVIVFWVGLPFLIFVFTRRRGSPKADPLTNSYSPSADLPPAAAGMLIDGRTLPRHITAALIDLAGRGWLDIKLTEARGDHDQPEFLFRRLAPVDQNQEGSPLAQALLDAFFEGQPECSLNASADRLYMQRNVFTRLLERALQARGWIDARRRRMQRFVRILGGWLLVTGIAVLVLTIMVLPPEWIAFGILISILLTAVGLIIQIIGGSMNILSARGIEETALAKTLRELLRPLLDADDADRFASNLPYAVAFGDAASWIEHFAVHEQIACPDWFHSSISAESADAPAPASLKDAAAPLNALIDQITTVLTADL